MGHIKHKLELLDLTSKGELLQLLNSSFFVAIALLLHLKRPYFGDSHVFLSSIDIISDPFKSYVRFLFLNFKIQIIYYRSNLVKGKGHLKPTSDLYV